jgi:ribosomal protein S18 acetylase RimI-like enzyme
MTFTPIRLTSLDATRYVRLRLRMLTESPWAFSSSPSDDFALAIAQVAALLQDAENAIVAVEAPVDDQAISEARDERIGDLIAAGGIRRRKGSKFAHRAVLWGVFVEPAWRGRGVGRRIVEAAVGIARGWRGVEYVDLGVSENAPAARHLYEGLGFRAWGREPEATEIDDRRYDEIYMTLHL